MKSVVLYIQNDRDIGSAREQALLELIGAVTGHELARVDDSTLLRYLRMDPKDIWLAATITGAADTILLEALEARFKTMITLKEPMQEVWSAIKEGKVAGLFRNMSLPEHVRTAIRYDFENLHRFVSTRELARMAARSVSSLHADFVKAFGLSIGQFRIHMRMEQVKRLLKETDLGIAAIATVVGYEEKSLSNRFKKSCGVSMSTYRTHKMRDCR